MEKELENSGGDNIALRLTDVVKVYGQGDTAVTALKGVSINFRKNEFVSVLGPSGCGKTTMLNIIGGLDRYTSGDMLINGVSTKNYKDRNWDIYRNHSIGFIFQSYNLIPHQTVLQNVELALTISGVSREERVARAVKALEKVGLKGETHKRPNQLSGGQCQRVAIARALVNEPDILLADEPTGALDSKTSVQIMELIKEISKDKLVIMVTHNAELAEEYSTRIVRLTDGEIVEDTNPYFGEEIKGTPSDASTENVKNVKKNKAKMNWVTAFRLSFRNLLSKLKRTLLTSIAGSIGIIGISAVLAVSSGVNGFIANMQDDMLSGNPITITDTAFDLNAMISGMDIEDTVKLPIQEGKVNVEDMLGFLANRLDDMNTMIGTNNLTQDYVDYVKAMPSEYATVLVNRGLNVANNIFTDFTGGGANPEIKNISLSAMKSIYTSVMNDTEFAENSSMITSLGQVFNQAPNDDEYILSQYDIKYGKLAHEKDEVMIVVNNDMALTNMALGQLGYYTQKEFLNIAFKATEDNRYDSSLDIERFTYEELIGREFVYYNNDTLYNKTVIGDITSFTYNHDSENFAPNSGMKLNIVGILCPKENLNYGCLDAGFYYTEKFADYAVEQNKNSEIAEYIESLPNQAITTVFSSEGVMGGITFNYGYYDIDDNAHTDVGYIGSSDTMSMITSLIPGLSMGGMDYLTLSLREVGGDAVSNDIKIYAKDLEKKEFVLEYLDKWNDENEIITVNGKSFALKTDDKDVPAGYEARTEIKYTDTLSIIMSMLTSMVDIVTIALVSFTSLALVVSCVMISIITYVSVVERVKEIGVIRSLGGRKKDVSNLFNAETLVIGLTSGLIGVGFTYFMSLIVNLIVSRLIGFAIMTLPITSALIMILLSVGLTMLSGLIPAKKASRQDPVVALRTE